jgi:methionyl-tRNA formyltransferase
VTRAVVFAYHDVGVRCLRVLLAQGVQVPLVVTHADNPAEQIWFASVAQQARWHGLEVAMPADPNTAGFLEQVRAARPDFLFSFYYRHMLGTAPGRGAARRLQHARLAAAALPGSRARQLGGAQW